MTSSRIRTPLHQALESYGRRARELSVEAMLAMDDVLVALVGKPQLELPGYRDLIAEWVVGQLHSQIAGIPDSAGRRLAQVLLASEPGLVGKNVTERLKYVREHDRGCSDHQFKTYRYRILAQLASGLARAYRARADTPIFLGGNYTDPRWNPVAGLLGRTLAQLPVSLLVMASRPALETGYAMAETLQAHTHYTPDRLTLFRRTTSRRPAPVQRNFGTLEFLDKTLDEARHEMIRRSRLVILFGGGAGTATEARIADEAEIPVVPLAFTGGTAQEYWLTREPGPTFDPGAHHALADTDHETAIRAALDLITHHLGLHTTPDPI
ncbi:hypothetical protein [Nocardia sp. BMG51109]|uniref:hypothetical protein n=1 Tax=Nocardia sp. BMG51109 TaxID=1056816 RepID=UPI0012EC1C6B|nr:hypothetical protein [Nocardia sp. BMG51109]